MPQLTCKNLTLGYENNVVLRDVNFQVNTGDYLCIIGENGTGKSTLMKSILGLKKQTTGQIIWGDGLQSNEIGYLTQQSEIQKEFPASVKEVVLSGFQNRCGLRPFYTKAEKAQARAIMEKMGIADYAKRCYRALSGGQQQRVLLSRALCATQKILFLDEPVTGLDPTVSAEMYALIAKLHREEQVTIVMISHDVQTAISYATHILKLGAQPFYGTKAQYLQHIDLQKQGGNPA